MLEVARTRDTNPKIITVRCPQMRQVWKEIPGLTFKFRRLYPSSPRIFNSFPQKNHKAPNKIPSTPESAPSSKYLKTTPTKGQVLSTFSEILKFLKLSLPWIFTKQLHIGSWRGHEARSHSQAEGLCQTYDVLCWAVVIYPNGVGLVNFWGGGGCGGQFPHYTCQG